MQKQPMQSQLQMQSQQIAAQVSAQKMQMELQSKLKFKEMETQYNIKIMQVEAELKSHLMAEEFMYNEKLHGMEMETVSKKQQDSEVAKDKRISIQNTQQSKLIDQRKNNLPPLNFESNEDSLDGFDFGEFDPR
jgi:hypothetical protein